MTIHELVEMQRSAHAINQPYTVDERINMLETLRSAIGQCLAQGVYIAIVAAVHILGSYGAYWLYRLLQKILQPTKQTV